MAKAKLTVKGDFRNFKLACAMADIEIIDAADFEGIMSKAEVQFKNPAQLRDLGRYEIEVENKNVK